MKVYILLTLLLFSPLALEEVGAQDQSAVQHINQSVGTAPTIDGNLSDVSYTTIGLKQNSNAGFGGAIDVSKLVFFSDIVNQRFYVGIVGKFDTGTNNGIGLFLNIAGPGSPSGKPAGQSLGIAQNGGHYIGADNNAANANFKADFEVDYLFAFNPGNSTTSIYVDAAKHVSASVIEYQGSSDQSGNATTNTSASGNVFPANVIQFAVNNGGGTNQGIEISIPWSAVGADQNMSLEAFAFVASNTAFFADVTVPGNVPPTIGDANPGFNADFGALAGGPYHTAPPAPLPVQIASLTARAITGGVRLDWSTASESNNYGFFIQRKEISEQYFTDVPNGFVAGAGNSSTVRYYTFIDESAGPGTWQYRLRQQDLDGSIRFTEPVQVSVVTAVSEIAPRVFMLQQNYPNPFNPATEILFTVDITAHARLTVYNTLGQPVATLFDDVAEAGAFHRVRFNAAGLSSGMYLYKLQSGSHVAVKKLLLMK